MPCYADHLHKKLWVIEYQHVFLSFLEFPLQCDGIEHNSDFVTSHESTTTQQTGEFHTRHHNDSQ